MFDRCDADINKRSSEWPPGLGDRDLAGLLYCVSTVKHGRAVFTVGEPKQFIFRVETGSIGLGGTSESGLGEIVEEVGPGTVFGLGFLDAYAFDAIALCESVVSCWSNDALVLLEKNDPAVRDRIAAETEREFNHRRTQLVAKAPTTPCQRLAGFLCVAARLNEAQGRDPCLIDETVECASVGAFLKLNIDELRNALVDLQKAGLIAHEPPDGVRILNTEKLQELVGDKVSQGSKRSRFINPCHPRRPASAVVSA